jgi:hypothetical protein
LDHLLDVFASRAPILALGWTSSWRFPELVHLLKGRKWLLPSEAGGRAANWELVE